MAIQMRFAHVFHRRRALWRGTRDAFGSPMLVLLAGMIAYGSVAHQQGFNLWVTSLGSVFIFALPGQVVMQEMLIAGVPVISIVLAVLLTASRFVTMSITLMPQFQRRDRGPALYLWVHLVAMTSWAVSMRTFPSLPPRDRLPYFVGFATAVWLVSFPGTYAGYWLSEEVPNWMGYGLALINPLFFLMSFVELRSKVTLMAVLLGLVLGPITYLWDPTSSLLISGFLGGTIAYFGVKRWERRFP
jgi:predicted branched-subunit amino acid permease